MSTYVERCCDNVVMIVVVAKLRQAPEDDLRSAGAAQGRRMS